MLTILLALCFIIGFVALVKIMIRLSLIIGGVLLTLAFIVLVAGLVIEPLFFAVMFIVALLLMDKLIKSANS